MRNKKFGKRLTAKLFLFAAVAMAFFQSVSFAAYDNVDHLWIVPELGSWYDSNVFRIADHADTQQQLGSDHRNDYVWQPKVSGHFDTDISRQNFFVDGSLFSRSYQKHSNLNYIGSDNLVGWNWAIGSDWSGVIKYGVVRDLSSFEDIATAQRDMRTANNVSGELIYKLTSHWQFLADGALDHENHSVSNELDLKNTSIGGGIQYLTDKGSAIVFRHDHSDINYEHDYFIWRADTRGYQQNADQIIVTWPVTNKLKTTVNVGNVRWHYDTDNSNHSSSFGGISSNWNVTEKTMLSVAYNRQLSVPSQSLDTSMSNAYSMTASWLASTKLQFDASHKLTKQDYTGTNSRTDDTKIYRLSCSWMPLLNWKTAAYWQTQTRDSELQSYRYSADTIGLSLQYKY